MAARNRTSRPSLLARWRERAALAASAEGQRPLWWRALKVVVVFAVSVFGVYRLWQLDAEVQHAYAERGPADIRFVDLPETMEPVAQAALARFIDTPWSDPALCADIADALDATGWVRSVERVHRFADGRVEIACTFRSPIAMVQGDHGFYLIDADCVRLPGQYTNEPGFPLLVGAASSPPMAGDVWPGDDIRAGVALVKLISAERFRDQISGILVGNYGGRRDPHRAQLALATDRAGGRIIWGSPIGEEIEENTVAQKLDLLRSNYQRYGRVDAHRAVLDVSVHPDRIIAPASADASEDTVAGL